MSSGQSLRVFRGIVRELQRLSVVEVSYKQAAEYQFLLQEYRQCCGVGEAVQGQHNALNYLCLLQSLRKNRELCQEYKGAGERPVEEMAKMVGFQLPVQYAD